MPTLLSRHALQVILCLVLVYISWGSCFIFIRFALESFPPFILCGLRMAIAGIFLFALTWLRGERILPNRADWKRSFLLAFYLVFVASGFLSKGQEFIASGVAAMILGTVPIWMVLADWLTGQSSRPSALQFTGLGSGFVGLVLLACSQNTVGGGSLWGLLLVVLAALGWVYGSLLSKRYSSATHLSVMSSTALIMFLGGIQSLCAAAALGEFSLFSPDAISLRAALSLLTLILLGAVVAYTCYFWLLVHTRTVVAISYEYVNPVIGVFLGWCFADEPVTSLMILACCLTVSSVFLIVSRHKG